MNRDDVGRRQVLSGLLGVALVAGVLGLVFYAVAPVPATPGDTEFYVVNESGTAADYPTDLTVGEEATVVVGIANDEHRQMTYELLVRSDETQFDRRSVTLSDGDTWTRSLTLSFDEAGEHRVALQLYRDGTTDGDPYRRLRLVFQVESA